jgi:hypothetical protein
MSWRTTVSAVDPVCVEAVREFAAKVAEKTALRPTVKEGHDSVGMDFLDDASHETTLCVEWAWDPLADSILPGTYGASEETSDNGPDGQQAPQHTVHHYERTLKALARNAEAARAFLGSRNLCG